MSIMAQAAIVFGLCLISEGIAALLPVSFPASVIALLLLGLLLFSRALKPEHIQQLSTFLVANMAFFFLPSCVEMMEHAPAILRQLLPFLLVVLVTTPVVYGVTAWTVQLLVRRLRGRGVRRHV
ncbi:CidA/LrgA family protein [Pseudoflavonifractor sp. 60]|uniref:CidA/LrgA family protein n=1 Tax=Pseudoflavonifractor sp. 60 TaxID=2304576 RepID=UPI00136B1532|nr:CidA/LrgA family protein [Pseudoflavonifractor sp. 60]NBI67832.1 CidA/LrgA family protein [Pseudoflavonifractor sp. 60]